MSVLGPAAVGVAAGFLGSVLGLGGGVVIVPGLVFLFGLSLRAAVAVSLVGIAATSVAAAAVYLRAGRVDVPLALRLESAAVVGAVAAGLSAHLVPETVLQVAFAAVVLYTAVAMVRGPASPSASGGRPDGAGPGSGDAAAGGEVGPDAGEGGTVAPSSRRPAGSMAAAVATSGGAGVASALLGVGGGFAKVPIMHLLLRVPLPVATATSALMVGMTAAASGWIYWTAGELSVAVAAPVALGVLAGSTAGSAVSGRLPDRAIRAGLVLVLLYVAGRMAWEGLGGMLA